MLTREALDERADADCTGHEPGCPGAVGGDHVVLRMNAMRCTECGHRLDDMGGCDSCAADREAEGWMDAG